MLRQKGKKSLIYFFLIIFVGSINNLSLSNIKLENIKDIKVTGLNDNDNSIIISEIRNLELENIFFIKSDQIKKIIDRNPIIEKYKVYKNYPSTLEIKIVKTKFLAKINKRDKIFIIGANGKLSSDYEHKNKLPFIFGKPEVQEFLKFKKIIDQSNFEYNLIKNFYFFPSKRWDLELKSNVILKLPEKNTKENFNYIYEFLNNQILDNIKLIDTRIQNQIIIND